MELTLFVLEDVVVLPEDGHAPPALLSILFVLHHKMAAKVVHALPLLADGVVHHPQRRVVAEMEILAVPVLGEVTARA